jgi:hypothetical protein
MDNIKDKIRKLLALSADKGATEDEAASALRMAMALMAKHGIEQDQLGVEKPKSRVGKVAAQAMQQYQVLVAQAAGHLYGCKVMTYNHGKSGFSFVGRPDNIDAAEDTCLWLFKQVEAIYKEALPPGLTQQARARFRKHFKNGCALRIWHRVQKLITDQDMVKATGSNAMVVKGYFEGLMAEAAQVLEERGVVKGRASKIRYSDQGYAAGDTVKLRREAERSNHGRISHG